MIETDVFKQQDLLTTPGSMLRKAREAKGMDIVAVAAMLHLTEFRIMAIESDDFDSLPEPVFVRGYLKNYARLLNEPAGPILDAYAKYTSETINQYQPEHKIVDSKIEGWANGDHDLVKMVSILLVVVAIVFPVVWWWDDIGSLVGEIANTKVPTQPELAMPEPAPSEDKQDTGLSEIRPIPITGNDVATYSPVVEEDKGPDSAVIQPLPEVEIKPIETATGETEPPATEGNSISIPIPQQVETVEEVKPAAEPPAPKPVVATVTVPIPAQEPAPKPVKPVSAPVGVWFKFVDSGWVKVRDAKDRVILIGEHEKGTRKKLTSVMPYKVVLGNSNAVQVEINGKPADISRFSSGGVARFTIDDGKVEKP